MVPSDRAVATSYRLSTVTMSPCAAVWPQFSTQGFSLLVAVSQKRSAFPSDSWAFCFTSGFICGDVVVQLRSCRRSAQRTINNL